MSTASNVPAWGQTGRTLSDLVQSVDVIARFAVRVSVVGAGADGCAIEIDKSVDIGQVVPTTVLESVA